MWALAEHLQASGIITIPSSSVGEARLVLAEIQPHLSLVIVNCQCHGACSFAEQLRKKDRLLRVIGIISRGFGCRECHRGLSATLQDPEDRGPERLAQCAELIRILVDRPRTLQ